MKLSSYFLILFLAPFQLALAQVVISEIMYDLEGSDSGREWIEIKNTGADIIDLTNWKFFENDTNHGLTLVSGSESLPVGGYAIIADNTEKFLLDYPSFSGTLFDSTFSLKNTGETISIRDAEGNDSDSVSYDPLWGAEGDGNSLQLSGSSFVPAPPTPGVGDGTTATSPAETPEENETEESTEENTEESTEGSTGGGSSTLSSGGTTSGGGSSGIIEPVVRETSIYANAGSDRTVIVGADEFFKAAALKTDKTNHPYAVFRWNFGNGVTGEGRSVLHHYDHPGTYVVQLTAYSPGGTLSATDRMTVNAVPAQIIVSSVSPHFIEISNNGGQEINLSMWSLRAESHTFSFPTGTIILSGAKLKFPNTVTGLRTQDTRTIALLFPNGNIAHSYGSFVPKPVSARPISTAVAPPPVAPASTIEPVTQSALTLTATPVLSGAPNTAGSGLYKWVVALIGLMGAVIGGLLFMREKEVAPEAVTAKDIKLLD